MCSRRDTHTHLVLVLELGKATSQYDHILLFAGWQLSLGDSLVARLGIYASCLGTAVWEERDVDASVGLRESSIGTRPSTSSRLLPLLREVTVEDDLLVCGGRGRMTESVFTLVRFGERERRLTFLERAENKVVDAVCKLGRRHVLGSDNVSALKVVI